MEGEFQDYVPASAFIYLLNYEMLQPKCFKTLRKGENIAVPMLSPQLES